ncbi:MAG: hypothetical protein EA361_18850 [Bacteroidetes bacterium]|nr:MAG: hypothetical protein EA361_18850 [Bacteroidota bacterium]
MLRNSRFAILLTVAAILAISCTKKENTIEQVSISRVETMPHLPEPYKMLNWKEVAQNFDRYVFDHTLSGEHLPFIWLDNSQRNFPQETFGLFTAIGDLRQGPEVYNGEFHEAINSLGALMSAGLLGIDKTNQDGYNYVKMVQNYFNSDNGWNIIMNNTSERVGNLGGGYARDWWYDVFPNVLYWAMADLYPDVDRTDSILLIVAEQFYKADSVLAGNYHYSFFDYSAMEGRRSHIPLQEDAAAGHAWVLLAAYQKFGDARYLAGAHSATSALLSQTESRFYEVLMPFGAYVAARLNAEHGGKYDFHPILDWTFDGTHAEDGRYGWGIINERWGDFDVHGLQGSWSHDGGFAFLMNTFDMAWPLVPMVRYDPRYANTIGKWMLNAANAARLFYPNEIPDANQTLPQYKNLTRNVIGYEGVKKIDHFDIPHLEGVSPVALGDGPLWVDGNPDVSQFSLYGSAHAGIFGAIIQKTNVEKILRLDCLATDFYRNEAYPTYLIYNPYDEEKEIDYFYEGEAVYLFDVLQKKVLVENITGTVKIQIPAQQSRLIVEIPRGKKLWEREGLWIAGDVVVAFR